MKVGLGGIFVRWWLGVFAFLFCWFIVGSILMIFLDMRFGPAIGFLLGVAFFYATVVSLKKDDKEKRKILP